MRKFTIFNNVGTFISVEFEDGSSANINVGEKIVGIMASKIGARIHQMARNRDILIQEERVSRGKFAKASDEHKPPDKEEMSKSKKHKVKEI